MTAYEIVSSVLMTIGTVVSLGGFVIALLNFLNNRNSKKK